MNKEQPETLRLADALEAIHEYNADSLLALNVIRQAGPELRRLHAENEALRAQIGCSEPVGQCMEHGECFGGECIYATKPNLAPQPTADFDDPRVQAVRRCGIDRIGSA